MDVLILQVFVSFVLVASSLILFAFSAKQREHAHADRLALLPIEDEHTVPHEGTPSNAAPPRPARTPR
jgi:hypothetical protein